MENEIINKLTRCPRLGQEINFGYCLQESGELPCSRILQCWSPAFDIEKYLRETMSSELWNRFINAKPKEKILSLVEIIEAAKKRE